MRLDDTLAMLPGASAAAKLIREVDPSGLAGEALDSLGSVDAASLLRRGVPAVAGAVAGAMSPIPGGAFAGGVAGAQAGRAWDAAAQTGDPMTGLGWGPLAADVVYNSIPGAAGLAGQVVRNAAPVAGRFIAPLAEGVVGMGASRVGQRMEGVEPSLVGDVLGFAGGLTTRSGRLETVPDPRAIVPGTGGGRAGGLSFGELFPTRWESFDSELHTPGGLTAAERRIPEGLPSAPKWTSAQKATALEAANSAREEARSLGLSPKEAKVPTWARAVLGDSLEPHEASALGIIPPENRLPELAHEQPRLALRQGDGQVAQMAFPDPPAPVIDATGPRRIVEPGIRANVFRSPWRTAQGSAEPAARWVGAVGERAGQAASRILNQINTRVSGILRDTGKRAASRGYLYAEVPNYRNLELFPTPAGTARLADTRGLRAADQWRSMYDELRGTMDDAGVAIYRDGQFIPFGEGRDWYVPHVFRQDSVGDRLRDFFSRSEPRGGPLGAMRSRVATSTPDRLPPLREAAAAAQRDAELLANSAYFGRAFPNRPPVRFQGVLRGLEETSPQDAKLLEGALVDAAHGPAASSSRAAVAWSGLAKSTAARALLQYAGPRQLAQWGNVLVDAGPLNVARGVSRYIRDPDFRSAIQTSGSKDVSLFGEGALANVPGRMIRAAEGFNRTFGVAPMVSRLEQIGNRALRRGSVSAAWTEDAARWGYTPQDLAQRMEAGGGRLSAWDVREIAERTSERTHFTQRPGTVPGWMLTPLGSAWTQFRGFPLRAAGWTGERTVRPAVLAGRALMRGDLSSAASLGGRALANTAAISTVVPLAQAAGNFGATLLAGRAPTAQDLMPTWDPTGGMGAQAVRLAQSLASKDTRAVPLALGQIVAPPVTVPLIDAARRLNQGRPGDAALGLVPALDPWGLSGYAIRPELHRRDTIHRLFSAH